MRSGRSVIVAAVVNRAPVFVLVRRRASVDVADDADAVVGRDHGDALEVDPRLLAVGHGAGEIERRALEAVDLAAEGEQGIGAQRVPVAGGEVAELVRAERARGETRPRRPGRAGLRAASSAPPPRRSAPASGCTRTADRERGQRLGQVEPAQVVGAAGPAGGGSPGQLQRPGRELAARRTRRAGVMSAVISRWRGMSRRVARSRTAGGRRDRAGSSSAIARRVRSRSGATSVERVNESASRSRITSICDGRPLIVPSTSMMLAFLGTGPAPRRPSCRGLPRCRTQRRCRRDPAAGFGRPLWFQAIWPLSGQSEPTPTATPRGAALQSRCHRHERVGDPAGVRSRSRSMPKPTPGWLAAPVNSSWIARWPNATNDAVESGGFAGDQAQRRLFGDAGAGPLLSMLKWLAARSGCVPSAS